MTGEAARSKQWPHTRVKVDREREGGGKEMGWGRGLYSFHFATPPEGNPAAHAMKAPVPPLVGVVVEMKGSVAAVPVA